MLQITAKLPKVGSWANNKHNSGRGNSDANRRSRNNKILATDNTKPKNLSQSKKSVAKSMHKTLYRSGGKRFD